jgi:hypothetical protein
MLGRRGFLSTLLGSVCAASPVIRKLVESKSALTPVAQQAYFDAQNIIHYGSTDWSLVNFSGFESRIPIGHFRGIPIFCDELQYPMSWPDVEFNKVVGLAYQYGTKDKPSLSDGAS